MKKRKIVAIFLDIDDTLYSTSGFTRQARWKAMEAMVNLGLAMSTEKLFQELLEVISEFSSNYSHHYDKLLSRIPAQAYRGINRAILIAAAVAAYHDAKHTSLHAYPDALCFLQDIARLDLIRGIITEGLEIKQAEKIVRLQIYPYLTPHAIFISDQIGISKPNPKLYRHVCQSLQIEPRQVVYIGDHPFNDVDSPNHLGIVTIRIRRDESKYNKLDGKTQPDYQICNFDNLLAILHDNFILGD